MDDERRGDARKETRTIVRDDADDRDPSGQATAHLEVRGGAPSTGDDGRVLGDRRSVEALPVSLRHGSLKGREGRGGRWRVAHDPHEIDTALVAERFPPAPLCAPAQLQLQRTNLGAGRVERQRFGAPRAGPGHVSQSEALAGQEGKGDGAVSLLGVA